MSDSSEPPPLVSSSEDEDEESDVSSDSSTFEELTSHQLRNYALFYDRYRRALKRWTFEAWVGGAMTLGQPVQRNHRTRQRNEDVQQRKSAADKYG